jgi:hypothetical protein
MMQIFIRFEANKMALFACFASKRISKFYMRNEFRPEANFRFKRIFEAKYSEYFVTEPNIAKPTDFANVTSKRNGVTHLYRFSHVIREIILKSNNDA